MRGIDPDLLDGGVIQEWLQGTETGDGIKDVAARRLEVSQRWKGPEERPLVIVADRGLNKSTHIGRLLQGIQTPAADKFADLALDYFYSVHISPNGHGLVNRAHLE
jgi:hypothetical protein